MNFSSFRNLLGRIGKKKHRRAFGVSLVESTIAEGRVFYLIQNWALPMVRVVDWLNDFLMAHIIDSRAMMQPQHNRPWLGVAVATSAHGFEECAPVLIHQLYQERRRSCRTAWWAELASGGKKWNCASVRYYLTPDAHLQIVLA